MIFASDLDRTLIYSRKAMGEAVREEELVPVELYEGEYISYMTKRAITLLTELTQYAVFVPVTTRTIEQYKRIFHLVDTFKPKYAITSNGGNVLVDGEPDREWLHLLDSSRKDCAEPLEVKEVFDGMASLEWALRGRLCDELFYSIIIERDKLPLDVIESLSSRVVSMGWDMSIQGRKLYLVPKRITKGAALRYVKEKLHSSFVAAAGDSLLDESLLAAADFALPPSHGELFHTYRDTARFEFTNSSGILASEEIISRSLDLFRSPVVQSSPA